MERVFAERPNVWNERGGRAGEGATDVPRPLPPSARLSRTVRWPRYTAIVADPEDLCPRRWACARIGALVGAVVAALFAGCFALPHRSSDGPIVGEDWIGLLSYFGALAPLFMLLGGSAGISARGMLIEDFEMPDRLTTGVRGGAAGAIGLSFAVCWGLGVPAFLLGLLGAGQGLSGAAVFLLCAPVLGLPVTSVFGALVGMVVSWYTRHWAFRRDPDVDPEGRP
jgi:hypothetical protein